jgi:hypothetical protein
MSSSPDVPEEDPAVKRLRSRQLRELAELDEEENERLKKAFQVSRGVRAFSRVSTTGNAADNARGGRVSRPITGPVTSGGGGGGGVNRPRVSLK